MHFGDRHGGGAGGSRGRVVEHPAVNQSLILAPLAVNGSAVARMVVGEIANVTLTHMPLASIVDLVSGSAEMVEHIGFTTTRLKGAMCGSGRDNTVESVASGRALAANAAALGHVGLTGREVYAAHLAGKTWASNLVANSAAAIAELSSNLKAVLDIDAVIIGGGVGLADGYVGLVEEHLQAEPELFRPATRRAALAENSALLGVLVS